MSFMQHIEVMFPSIYIEAHITSQHGNIVNFVFFV